MGEGWFVGSLVRWFVGSLVRWFVGSLVRWFVGSLVRWFVGSLGRWVVGSLGRWVVGSLGRWVVGRGRSPGGVADRYRLCQSGSRPATGRDNRDWKVSPTWGSSFRRFVGWSLGWPGQWPAGGPGAPPSMPITVPACRRPAHRDWKVPPSRCPAGGLASKSLVSRRRDRAVRWFCPGLSRVVNNANSASADCADGAGSQTS